MNGHTMNGHTNGKAPRFDILERMARLDNDHVEKRGNRDAESSYLAGESDRMNPVPRGVNPLGTDADYHYRTERNYFLMVERGRAAVRNHPLVEQGINRLIANVKVGDMTLDVDSGDIEVDDALLADHNAWMADKKLCDYEQSRTFQQIARQSFFNQVVDGDILHVPLNTGQIQTFESHHIRTPYGHRPTGLATDGIIHGVDVSRGRITGYYVTPQTLLWYQAISRLSQSYRIPAFDSDGNSTAFWLGFTHRFAQRRGISRLSPPRDAMNGFDDLNYANIKSSLRRALISYMMESNQSQQAQTPASGAKLPQGGGRYSRQEVTRSSDDVGLGLESLTIEMMGEPAQVMKAPLGYTMQGWNANMPVQGFFDHAALLLTMLAVNLDIPLMFLLLDGSLVNFHGGRMTFDQAKMRFMQLQKDQIEGLWNPTYEWRIRRKLTPGSPDFDRALFAATKSGQINPFNYCFHRPAWPYVKPMEDAAAEKLAETSNLRSMRQIQASRGENIDKIQPEIVYDRQQFFHLALDAALETQAAYPTVEIDPLQVAKQYMQPETVMMTVTADTGTDTAKAKEATGGSDESK